MTNKQKSNLVIKCTLATIVLLLVVGAFLPNSYSCKQVKLIRSRPDATLETIADLKNFNMWNPWKHIDSNVIYDIAINPKVVGSTVKWHNPQDNTLNGGFKVVEYVKGERIDLKADFGKQGDGLISVRVKMTDNGNCLISVDYFTFFGWNLMSRYFGVFMDRYVAPDVNLMLEKLKSFIESNPNLAPNGGAINIHTGVGDISCLYHPSLPKRNNG
jgi:hypothetical protein